MTQDVTVEAAAVEADNDVTVEEVQKQEPEIKDDVEDNAETESQEGEGEEEQPKTVEEQLAEAKEQADNAKKAQEAMQKKIDRQTAAYNKAQEALQKERQERQAALEKLNPVEEEEPQSDDFDTYQEYVDALSDFKAKQILQQKEVEFAQAKEKEAQIKMAQERDNIVKEQENEYVKVNPRYKASKNEFDQCLKTLNVNPQTENAIVEVVFDGNVPMLIDYFGSNNGEKLDEFEKITQLPPVKAAIEIYKIQQNLVAPQVEKEKPLPKPVKAAPATKSSKAITPQSDVLKSLGLK